MGVLMLGLPTSMAQPEDIFNQSGQPIPRFVSLGNNKVFVRTGPALRYPIKWVFTKKSLPVEVIQEFDTWRKIRDLEGEEGWIHQSLLSGKRNAVVTAEKGAYLVRKPLPEAKSVVLLENNVVAALANVQRPGARLLQKAMKAGLKKNHFGAFTKVKNWIRINNMRHSS